MDYITNQGISQQDGPKGKGVFWAFSRPVQKSKRGMSDLGHKAASRHFKRKRLHFSEKE